MKKILFLFTIALLLTFSFFTTKNISAQETTTLFYSNTCPFCHEVIEFLEENNLDIQTLESSTEGFQEIYEEACNIPLSQGGYPTLYIEETCIFGRTNSIAALSQIAGIENIQEETVDNTTGEEIMNQDLETRREPERIPHPVPSWMMITMFIGPAVLVYIGYLIIKKLNL